MTMSKPFDRIITVMFENQYRSYVIQNPFLKKLAAAGADMTNYFGAFHPSQTNYLASFAGEICGVTNDTPPSAPLMQKTLVDLLEAKKVSWNAYMEGYPGDPWNKVWATPPYSAKKQPLDQFPPKSDTKNLSRYYRKHNAFGSFHSVQKSKERWEKIVSEHEFWNVVNTKENPGEGLPEYSWFTPDIWNDGHYLYNTHIDTNPRTQLVPQVANFLEHIFFGTKLKDSELQGGYTTETGKIGFNLDFDLLLTDHKKAYEQSNIPKGTLIVVTFDEADFDASGYDTNYDGPNQIYTVLLGDMITPGTVIDTPYNHYNLIRTVEENFQLGSLKKNDDGANWFRFLWEESFSWNKVFDTDFGVANGLAITHESTGNHMVFSNAKGDLFESFQTKSGWTAPKGLDFFTNDSIAMTTIGTTSFLVYKMPNDDLVYRTYDVTNQKWSEMFSLNFTAHGSFDVFAFNDVEAQCQKLMLCWNQVDGFMNSMIGTEKGFSHQIVPVGHLTDGKMTLGQVGASLFLVYKERNTRKMRMCSYNTAAFNSFQAFDFKGKPASQNDTTIYLWSRSDFEVGHFSKKFAADGTTYQHLGQPVMATADGEMHMVFRAGYPDKKYANTSIFGLTGIYSAETQMSNGYGTLDQAGWTNETPLNQIKMNPNSPISMSSDGKVLTLVWQDATTGTIQCMQGGYH
jgi:hypothetical protein